MQDPCFTVDSNLCIHCGKCVADCVVHVLKSGADRVPVMPEDEKRFCIGCQHCLAVCPVGAISVCGSRPDDCHPLGAMPDREKMANLLRQRRSIRKFKPEPVCKEDLDHLLEMMRYTATGCNDRGLHFEIVCPERMAEFRKSTNQVLRFLIRTGIMRIVYPNYKRYLSGILNGEDMIYRDAPHMLVVSRRKKAPCGVADSWIAASYFDLCANAMGLGTCWCGFAMYAFKIGRIRKLLTLPEGYVPGAVLLFGHAATQYARTPAQQSMPSVIRGS